MKSSKYRNTKQAVWLMILMLAFGFGFGAAQEVNAATYTVTKTADTNDGVCDGDCSLREAIAAANGTADNDVINFDASVFAGTETITLGGSQLSIANNGSLIINGTGARLLTVSGNNASRVFYTAPGTNVTINGLTVTRGNGFGSAGWNTCGGGIFNDNATLTLNNLAVSGNSVPFGTSCNDGSGIVNWYGGTLNVINSTVNNNTGAAGISTYSGTANVVNSTISNNSGNWGGGIIANSGTVNLTNVTVSGNTAIGNPSFSGAGINVNGSTFNVRNSIIANSTGADCYSGGTLNIQNSLLEDGTCGVTNGVNNNRTGDPNLGHLANNGGATQTHALLAGSNAINTGDNCVITLTCPANNPPFALTTDQRGASRNGNVDIGAFELEADTDGDGVRDFTDNCPTTYNPERIAFAALGYSFDDYNIYVMNADGTGLTDLTADTVSINWEPAFSPDGSKIVFTSRRDGNYQIYIMNADGTNQTRLSNNGSDDYEPTFSPDGSKIAFTSSRDGNYQIYIMNADGTNQTRLTNNGVQGSQPTFSPDGSKIAFTSYSNNDIYIMNADGTGITNLTNSPGVDFDPVFSPDGSKIYFVFQGNSIRGIYVMNTDGTNRTTVTNNLFANNLAPSADGTKFIYSATGETAYSQLYVMNTDGTNATRLTNLETDLSYPAWGRQPDSDGDGTGDVCELPDDTTPPVITPTVSGTLGNDDWYVSDVQVSWNVVDDESSASTQNCDTVNVTTDTSGVTFTCSAQSAGGSNSQSVTVKRDATAPTITLDWRTAANGSGWNRTDVVFQWNCADNISGAAFSTVSNTLTSEGVNQSTTGTCADNAGNTAQDTQSGIKIDKTAPSNTFSSFPAPNSNGWNNTNVQLSWNCSDTLSGLAFAESDKTISSEGANQSSTGYCLDIAGNLAEYTQSGINIDKTAPTITFDSRTPTANSAGWNNTDVTINWSCADALSGAVNQTTTQTLDTEGASQTASGTCTDLAGNTASDSQGSINIDKTAPTISLDSRTPAANTNGWNNTSVQVNWDCSDTLSGTTSSSVSEIVSSEGTNLSANGTCTDNAGNTAQDTQSGINIDTTAPVITFDSRTAPNGNGWNNTNVQVNWTCADALSGAVDAAVNQSVSSEGENQSATGTCTDNAGNTAQNSQSGINIDRTAPTITFDSRTAPNAMGWNNSTVQVSWNCSDTLSGAASPSVNQSVSSEGTGQSALGTCTDRAGNTAQNTQSGINIDLTPPVLAPTVSPNPVLLGGLATASPNASDTLSGIASSSCDSPNTLSVGFKSVNCTATDKAGHTTTVAVDYRVSYNFAGFFQPIENLPMVNEVKAGQAIPIKFSLNGYQGMAILMPGYPVSGSIGCSDAEPNNTVEEIATQSNSSLSYSAGTDQYTYVWKTDKSWKGQCRFLVVRLIDGSEYYAKFRFK